MLTISYTVTPVLEDNLLAIDHARRTILTTPIAPLTERRFRWQARIDHLAGVVGIGEAIPKAVVVSTLTRTRTSKTQDEQSVIRNKIALDWIHETWSASPKPITPAALHALLELILPARQARRGIQDAHATIRYITTYLSSQKDHPVLLASVAHAEIAHSPLFSLSNGRLCRLLTTLILTKYGYDCRGMLSVEPEWQMSSERYHRALSSIETHGQMTLWHEYFSGSVLASLESLAQEVTRISEGVLPADTTPSWKLNERQERILSHFDNPTTKITNRDVQQRFRVSQVTASRDLALLAALGLIYGHGKGRSVYYTKL